MLIYFAVLSAVVLLINLIYAEIVMRTKEKHRVTGYAEIYLGKPGKIITILSTIFGLGGSLFAYFVVGGGFLGSLLSPVLGGGHLFYMLLFLLCGIILIYADIKSIAKIEVLGLILFFIILLSLFLKGRFFINLDNLFTQIDFFSRPLFLPYGAVLFSLGGAALIPEVVEIMSKQPNNVKKLIPLSSLIVAITYLIFIVLVLGVTGQNTTNEAIAGLKSFLGNDIIALGLFFGVLTTFTSFITLGLTFKKILWYDLKINPKFSWLIVSLLPPTLYILGLKDFIKIIGLIGGVLLGAEGIIIILAYLKSKKQSSNIPAWSLNLPKTIIYSLILFLTLGIGYEIFYFITNSI